MSNSINPNEGPGWGDHDTPYGPIHSYDGNNGSSSYGEHSGGNAGNNTHDGISENTRINIKSTTDYNGFYMSMCVNHLKHFESFKNVMYKDKPGNIIIGIGHLISSADMAASLPFSYTSKTSLGHAEWDISEMKASVSMIKDAFNQYKANSNIPPNGLHLSNDAIIGQCISDVRSTEIGLRGLYSGYDGFSDSRKTALVDMGFVLGIGKLKEKFVNFNAAVKRGDWVTAAKESHRPDVNDERNKVIHDQLLSNK